MFPTLKYPADVMIFCFRDSISKVTDVVNALGAASANAQGLTRPITTSDRLRNSEQQILYLLIDSTANQ